MEFDGFLELKVRLTAADPVEVDDIRLEVPSFRRGAVHDGPRVQGWAAAERFNWAWDQKKNQDALWLGDVNAGLQVGLRDENYSRPLNTNFYLSKPLNLPPSWWNDGRGGCTVGEKGADTVLFSAFSGPAGWTPDGSSTSTSSFCSRPSSRSIPSPFRDPFLPFFQAHRRGGPDGREHDQRPPRQRSQPLHQLSLPAAGRDEKYIDEAHSRG